MAKIDRYTGNLQPFGSNATGTERTVFGDTVQSDTLDGNITADFLLGWEKVAAGAKPPKQWFNGAMYTTTQLIAYLHQMGVPEYDAAQEYPINAFTNVGGVIYKSLVNSNIGNAPASSPAQWEDILAAAISDVAPNPAVTITGTTNALIATPVGLGTSALTDGLRISGRVATDNTSSTVTINYNGTGAKNISNVTSGCLSSAIRYTWEYISTTDNWKVIDSEPVVDSTGTYPVYFQYSNSKIKQGGQVDAAANSTVVVTMPVEFPSSFLDINACYNSSSIGIVDTLAATNTSLSQITIANGADFGLGIWWSAEGV